MDDMEKECIIAEKKTNAIINLLILIVLVIMVFIVCPFLLNNRVLMLLVSLLLCSTLISIVKGILYESFFVINEFGFSYGKRLRYKEKKVIKRVDYSWLQIKELYFETTTALHTILFLVVVFKNGQKNTIGMSLLPLSKEKLKYLVLRFSKRDNIFKD